MAERGWLNCAGVMSRDIKLQNTLLAPQPAGVPPMVKLCDFGYSKHEDLDSVAKSCVGTPAYIAPGAWQPVVRPTSGRLCAERFAKSWH